MNKPTPLVLSVAGSDPTCGAGVQADIKTAAALGGYCYTAITAITAQNSGSVEGVWSVSAALLEAQIRAVVSDCWPGAIKLGMLVNSELVLLLQRLLQEFGGLPLVLDPVLRATASNAMLTTEPLDLSPLFPLTTLLTPNLNEAAHLLGQPIARDLDDMCHQAESLVALGLEAVLLKGGHLTGEQVHQVLAQRGAVLEVFSHQRIASHNTHGTGCTLATAIAVELARGRSLVDAAKRATRYVQQAIMHADHLALLKRNGPLQHFF